MINAPTTDADADDELDTDTDDELDDDDESGNEAKHGRRIWVSLVCLYVILKNIPYSSSLAMEDLSSEQVLWPFDISIILSWVIFIIMVLNWIGDKHISKLVPLMAVVFWTISLLPFSFIAYLNGETLTTHDMINEAIITASQMWAALLLTIYMIVFHLAHKKNTDVQVYQYKSAASSKSKSKSKKLKKDKSQNRRDFRNL